MKIKSASLRLVYIFISFVAPYSAAHVYTHGQSLLQRERSLRHPASRMGVENRKPIPKSLEKKFAATGLIICGTDAATAQVTGAEKVLTTAGHQFADDKCQPTNREKCHFERTVNGRIKEYPLDMKSLKVGGPCADGVNDWAVVKLRAPIPGVTPYEILEEENILIEGEEIVQISGFHDNYSIN